MFVDFFENRKASQKLYNQTIQRYESQFPIIEVASLQKLG